MRNPPQSIPSTLIAKAIEYASPMGKARIKESVLKNALNALSAGTHGNRMNNKRLEIVAIRQIDADRNIITKIAILFPATFDKPSTMMRWCR
ncbi:MAG: hypothetical protein HKM93_16105 [Desulfobacteraceae bacterium]|nr:hypothetical protein [Desulfobacteraceae bacterium]